VRGAATAGLVPPLVVGRLESTISLSKNTTIRLVKQWDIFRQGYL